MTRIGGGPIAAAAAIDVGSNSVLLLVVTVADGAARAIDEAVTTTRLGAGLRPGGALDPEAVRRTTDAVVAFAERARARGAADVHAFATGAARRASDGEVFAAATARAAELPVEILSGAREAALAYGAVVHGLALDDETVLAIDVGGATTELTLGRGSVIAGSASLPVGALTLFETSGDDLARGCADIAAALDATDLPARARAAGAALVASGGTPTSLAALALGLDRYDPRRVHGAVLDAARMAALATGAARRAGAIDAGRAAILPAGACILDAVMRASGVMRVRVSDHGVRHAYLRERLAERGIAAAMRELWG